MGRSRGSGPSKFSPGLPATRHRERRAPATPGSEGSSRLDAAQWPASFSIPTEDLSSDPLLLGAPRMRLENGDAVPALGGIPLLAKLGAGGMGEVYFGFHPHLLVEVAVKVLPPFLLEKSPQLIDRFLREARIAARLRSPHLVSVLDVSQEGNLYYIVMEYVHGPSARDYLDEVSQAGRSGLDQKEALRICTGAARGLAAAHRKGIVHRDIKPGNILIPREAGALAFDEAKLADLGIARGGELDPALTATLAHLGTPGFMAPEQVQDAKNAGKPADVFSLGVTLYTLLCGRAPFPGSTTWTVLLATVSSPHTPIRRQRPDISPAVAALLDRCLAKAPDARYPDGAALLEAMSGCLAALEGQSLPVSPAPPAAEDPGLRVPAGTPPEFSTSLPRGEPTITEDLRSDHRDMRREMDKIIAACDEVESSPSPADPKGAAAMEQSLAFFRKALTLHMRKENEVLFPALLSAIPWASPMSQMASQHDHILQLLDAFGRAFDSLKEGRGEMGEVTRRARQIVRALQDDFFQEENVLFVQADSSLIGERATILRQAMDRLARAETEPQG